LRRHRGIESSLFLWPPASCLHIGRAIGVYGNAGGSSYRDAIWMGTLADRGEAMGIDWMGGDELSEAVPPAYTEWIGRQLIAGLA
jgi:DNA (cytosine-5)-methyltransferase 1